MSEKGAVVLTGGLGYIGSHTCVVLARAGHSIVIVDNLSNARPEVLQRVRALAPGAPIHFYNVDVRDRAGLEAVFQKHDAKSVVHFAGLKAVGESVLEPIRYYENNVGGTLSLLTAMQASGVRRIIFSSSAAVYGEPQFLPITENHPLSPKNPYGRTKLMIELLLSDHAATDKTFRVVMLRYFNPVGAHPSGTLGEDPLGVPSNLFPYIAQVAAGLRPRLQIFGDDYPTNDGTGVRDYIHVMDLARGHVAAMEHLYADGENLTANLGTGRGYSVREAVKVFEQAAGVRIAVEFAPRRAGDVAACFAESSLAKSRLGWTAELGLAEMCRDAWRWQKTTLGRSA